VITLVYLARLREVLGSPAEKVELPNDVGTVAALLAWLRQFGEVTKVGVEGTGSYGAGLARFLRHEQVHVVEVNRPNRQARRNSGKTDTLDAIEAARAALSGNAKGHAKSRDGASEAIRTLVVAKRSARQSRVKAIVQMRHLVVSSPEAIHQRFKDLTVPTLIKEAARLRPDRSPDTVTAATKSSLSSLARRIQFLDVELAALEEQIAALVAAAAPELLALFGLGPDTAASLLVAAGDNPERLRSEAAWARLCGVAPKRADSGKVTGHYRLDDGGDRQANSALWRIVMVRIAHDPETTAYFERRVKEGRTKRDVIRILKRYVAREVYRYLPRG